MTNNNVPVSSYDDVGANSNPTTGGALGDMPPEAADLDPIDSIGRQGSERTSMETSAMRGGMRVAVASPAQVEGETTKAERIQLKHIVQIFSKDPEIREVTPEQIERVKMSK